MKVKSLTYLCTKYYAKFNLKMGLNNHNLVQIAVTIIRKIHPENRRFFTWLTSISFPECYSHFLDIKWIRSGDEIGLTSECGGLYHVLV